MIQLSAEAAAQAARPSQNYDCIVIGSGIGGLTAATLLARVAKKRVLMLERHFKPGGFTHSFRRHEFEWDVGLHYVGEMQPGTLSRRVMDMVTNKRVQWQPMGSPYERFVFPDFTYEVPNSFDAYQAKLSADFPIEKRNIADFFRKIRAAQGWGVRWFVSKSLPSFLAGWVTAMGRGLAIKKTADVLEAIDDPQLKAVLGGQWPDMGTPPDSSAFVFHAMVAAHYANGAFYPVGGAGGIARAAVDVLREQGGDCLLNHQVEQILIENGRAVGVRARNHSETREFHAPVVISDAGARTTFMQLVPGEFCEAERIRSARLRLGPSATVLFLGLKANRELQALTMRTTGCSAI